MNEQKQATGAPVMFKNAIFLAGTIIGLTETGVMLQTINRVLDRRTGETKEYPEQNPVVIDKALLAAKGFEVGSRIQFYGAIKATENRIRRVVAYGATLAKAASDTDANMAEVAGLIGQVTYTPPDPIIRKQGFGKSFVLSAEGGTSVPVVFFQQMGQIWEKVPAQSEVVIGGRVRTQTRGYVDANGDLSQFTEIVADPTKSRVVKRAVVINAFAGVDFAALEAAEAGKEAPAPQEEAPAKQPKPKKGKAAVAPDGTPF